MTEMNDLNKDLDNQKTVAEPEIKKRSGPSLVWLIPLITLLIGGWLVFKTLSEKGTRITISFKTAEGIEAGKTKIKYKDIEIGVIEKVGFSQDFSHILLTAEIGKNATELLRRETCFWVVKPRLTMREVSNLGTLVSGSYIEIEPGQGEPQNDFVGLDSPPVIRADVAGKKIVLHTKKLGSLDTGSPVYYRGIKAGEVLGWTLGSDQKSIFIHAFIKVPYDDLIQSNTRFWNMSGINASIGPDGVNIKTESIQSILLGGIAFETPESLEKTNEDIAGLIFTLYDSYENIQEQSFTQKIVFILFFEGSVRGLKVGAPVEFKGIKIGTVKDLRLEFEEREKAFRIPVLIEIEPERIIERGGGKVSSPSQMLKELVDRGLRAQLKSASLIMGNLYVDLDMHPGARVRLVNNEGTYPYPELPTIPAEIEEITTSIKGFIAKLDKLNIDKISDRILFVLKGAENIVNAPELQNIMQDLKVSLNTFKFLLNKVDKHIDPVAGNLEKTIFAGQQTLEKVRSTFKLMDEILKNDSPLQYKFIELTEELTESARSIRALVDMLERNPNAVIFGKNASKEK